jgi:predicted transcriptional regulator
MPAVVARRPAEPRIQLNVTIDPALKAKIAALAASRGCFEARIVRDALVEYVDAAAKGARR